MKARIPLLLVLFFTALPPGAISSDAPMDRATLRGLKAVKAIIDSPDGTAMKEAGITVEKLAAQIEQRLAKEGIPVDREAREFLGLRVTFAHARKTDYALGLTLGVYQNVSLTRDPAMKTMAETWSGESILLVPPRMLGEAVANTLDQLVDQFIAAYRSANPG
jgi:hypothetical protein